MTNIFVAKLDFGVSDEALKALFEDHGTVVKCHIAKDRETGKPRGFAFIEMSSADQAQAAIDALDGHSINGRSMVVKLAEDRGSSKPRPASGGRGDNTDRPPRTERDTKSETRSSSDSFLPPLPPDGEESTSTPIEKASKRGKNKPKKSSDKPESREFKMSAYKKSGKNSRVEFEDDDDWELELLKQKRRGWSDDEEE